MIYGKIYCNLSNMQLQFVRVAPQPFSPLPLYKPVYYGFSMEKALNTNYGHN